MGDANTVSLSWVDHPRIFLDGIWDFFIQKSKVDIEVVYGGDCIQAHQLVLSIFSSILRGKLEEAREQPPLRLHLDQVTKGGAGAGADLEHLLHFIYKGKVDICSSRLKHLKQLAQALQIQGLVEAIQRQEGGEGHEKGEPPVPRRKPANPRRGARKRKGRPVKITKASDDATTNATRRRESAPRAAKSNPRTVCVDSFSEEEEGDRPSPPTDDSDGGPADAPSTGRTRKNRSLKLGPNMTRSEYKRLWRLSQPFVKCAHCAYQTRDKESLKKHCVKHDPNAQRFPCELCGKLFRNKAGLRCHLRLHGDPDQLHKCAHCPFQTPKKSSWVQHLAVIHCVDPQGNVLLRNVACTECDYTCVNDYQLKAHRMWKHTVDKPHKCPVCPYAAVIKRDVDKHVRIKHDKERPYMCEMCGFRSQTQGGHNRHVRSHSGVKPFKCEVCGQAYADSSKLKIHRQKHTSDDKPFVCHLCGHACRRMDNLQMHLKRIHQTHAPTDRSKSTNGATRALPSQMPPSTCQGSTDVSGVVSNSVGLAFLQTMPL